MALQLNADQRHFSLTQSRAMIETLMERMGRLLPTQADGGSQMAAFVDKPGTLTLSFNPPVPIAFEVFACVPCRERNCPPCSALTCRATDTWQ